MSLKTSLPDSNTHINHVRHTYIFHILPQDEPDLRSWGNDIPSISRQIPFWQNNFSVSVFSPCTEVFIFKPYSKSDVNYETIDCQRQPVTLFACDIQRRLNGIFIHNTAAVPGPRANIQHMSLNAPQLLQFIKTLFSYTVYILLLPTFLWQTEGLWPSRCDRRQSRNKQTLNSHSSDVEESYVQWYRQNLPKGNVYVGPLSPKSWNLVTKGVWKCVYISVIPFLSLHLFLGLGVCG